MKKQTPLLYLFMVSIFLMGSLTGCPGEKISTIVYGRGSDSKKLDPADITDGESVKVVTQLFDTLVTYAPNSSEIDPALATSWETSKDGMTWTFKLRSGVMFHDGTKLTADAVKTSIERLVKDDHPYRFKGGSYGYSEFYRMITSIETPDDETVVFKLAKASAVLLPNLAMFPASIVSPAALKKYGDKISSNPVGTGRYRFKTWNRGARIVLEANTNHWAGAPKTKRIIFTPVPENAARLNRLRQGEIHIMDGVDLSEVADLAKDSSVTLLRKPGMSFAYLAMNTQKKPFDNIFVRKAIGHAIDKKKIIERAYFGLAKPAVNPMPPSVWSYNDAIRDRPFDLNKARQFLRHAELPKGFETTLWVMPNPRPYMPEPHDVAQIIKQALGQIGIMCTIKSPDWSTYLEQTSNGEHDMCLLGWTTDNGDPDNFLHALLGEENAKVGSALNVSFYKDPGVSEILRRAQRMTKLEDRAKMYKHAQQQIFQDVPMVPLVYTEQIAVARNEIQGFSLHPIGIVRLWDTEILPPSTP